MTSHITSRRCCTTLRVTWSKTRQHANLLRSDPPGAFRSSSLGTHDRHTGVPTLAVRKHHAPRWRRRFVGLRAKKFRVSRPRMSDLSSCKPLFLLGFGVRVLFLPFGSQTNVSLGRDIATLSYANIYFTRLFAWATFITPSGMIKPRQSKPAGFVWH